LAEDTKLSMGVYEPPVKKLFSIFEAVFDSTISNISHLYHFSKIQKTQSPKIGALRGVGA